MIIAVYRPRLRPVVRVPASLPNGGAANGYGATQVSRAKVAGKRGGIMWRTSR